MARHGGGKVVLGHLTSLSLQYSKAWLLTLMTCKRFRNSLTCSIFEHTPSVLGMCLARQPTAHVFVVGRSKLAMAEGGGMRKVRNDYGTELDTGKPKKIPRILTEKDTQKRLIVVLENASLETVKVKGKITDTQSILIPAGELCYLYRWGRSLN